MYTRSRYKECNPKDTIERIKMILSELEIRTDVQWYNNIGSDFSCRVRIINENINLFGSMHFRLELFRCMLY